RAEVIDRSERQLHCEVASRPADPVGYTECRARRHACQYLVEIVEVDVDEPAILEPRQRLFRLSTEVAENADDERDLLLFDRVALLDVIGQLDTWRPHLLEALLDAFLLRHHRLPDETAGFQCVG